MLGAVKLSHTVGGWGRIVRPADGLPPALDLGEGRARVREEAEAAREQAHPSRRAREQRLPELVLQRAELAAHRGLRHAEARGGTTDVPLLGDGDEVAKLREAHLEKASTRATPRRATGARSKGYWTARGARARRSA